MIINLHIPCLHEFYCTVCISSLYVQFCIWYGWESKTWIKEKKLSPVSGLKWHKTETKYCIDTHDDWKMQEWYEKVSSFQILEKMIFESIKNRVWIRGNCHICQNFRIKISLETIVSAKLEELMDVGLEGSLWECRNYFGACLLRSLLISSKKMKKI